MRITPVQSRLTQTLWKLILPGAVALVAGSVLLTRNHPDESFPGEVSGRSTKQSSKSFHGVPGSRPGITPDLFDSMAPREMELDPSRPGSTYLTDTDRPSPNEAWSKRAPINTNLTAPGNSFVSNGSRVHIETTSRGNRSTIEVVIAPAEGDPLPAAASEAPRDGLTREQQAFRMKWGWATFDKVNRTLKRYDR